MLFNNREYSVLIKLNLNVFAQISEMTTFFGKKKAGAKLIATADLRPLESRDTNGQLLKNDLRDHSSQDV